jgi:hypothetical protein
MSVGKDRSNGEGLVAWVDADHAGDASTRRSTTGIVVTLDGSTILTISRRQGSVALSTFTSELNAITTALTELEWFSSILTSLPIGNPSTITLKTVSIRNDNLLAVNALNNETYIEERKTHSVKLRYVREQVASGFVNLEWTPGADNIADPLTKPLSAKVALEHGKSISLVDFPSSKGGWGSR